jgi:hypothetical protein
MTISQSLSDIMISGLNLSAVPAALSLTILSSPKVTPLSRE